MRKNIKAGIDALMWIENAPDKYQTIDEFVKEARLRGCCRELPGALSWVKCGQTKMFLVHRDRHKTPEKGSIFGYFIPHRIECISPVELTTESHKIPAAPAPAPPAHPTPIPNFIKRGEGHRMCSLRKDPGPVYAVDALCAAIHDRYQQLLLIQLLQSRRLNKYPEQIVHQIESDNKAAWEKWLNFKKNQKWSIDDLLDHYRGPFHEAVESHLHHDWRLKYPIDPRLKDKADVYRELVVFKTPYPVLQRFPNAAFRGVLHIDGDKLIDQIARFTGKSAVIPKIYYSGKDRCPEKKPIRTKAQLATCLAQELSLSLGYAWRFLDIFASEALEQLQHFGYFKLPGIGSISCQGETKPKIRFRPYKELSLKVTFHPYKAISEVCTIPPTDMPPPRIQTKKQLTTWMARQLKVKYALADRFLRKLSQMTNEELMNFGSFKLPGIGILRHSR